MYCVFIELYRNMNEVWENKKCCGNTTCRQVFPHLFRVLPNFHECCHNSIETGTTCFLFLLKKHRDQRGKQPVYFDYQIVNSLCSRYHYANSLCQFCSVRVFSQGCFLNSVRSKRYLRQLVIMAFIFLFFMIINYIETCHKLSFQNIDQCHKPESR